MLRVLVVLSSLGCVQEMKTTIEVVSNNRFPTPLPPSGDVIEGLLKDLDQNGIVLLPRLIPDEQLTSMQRAFESRLQRLRWNNFEGYEKTEPYRHMIEDVLLLDQVRAELKCRHVRRRIDRRCCRVVGRCDSSPRERGGTAGCNREALPQQAYRRSPSIRRQ